MTIMKGCMIAVVALAAGVWAEKARADEAFVCEGGRVAYVKPGQLETMKLQDPCIAKYFENVLVSKPVAAGASAANAVSTAASTVPAKVRSAEPVGDFRNVRIINASPGADGWFQHRR
jgi:hypothetical protein